VSSHTTISPSDLSPASKKHYRSIVAQYVLSPYQVGLLTEICRQRDIANEAWKVIKGGTTYTTSTGVRRVVPEIGIQRQALALQARLLTQLNLKGTPRSQEEGEEYVNSLADQLRAEPLSEEAKRQRARAEVERELEESQR